MINSSNKLFYPFALQNDFLFNKNSENFVVDEEPLYEFSGSGEHLVLKIRKKDIDTWQMLNVISKYLGISGREIGYAGLKDKDAMSMQHISILAKYEDKLKLFNDKKIKILSTTRHNNKLKLGHLKSNHFKIRLKKVSSIHKDKLNSTLKWIKQYGIPNYFGFQRFGNDGDNYLQGKDIIDGKLKMRNKKMKDFLIKSYQSHLFNKWLSKRIEISLLLEKFSESQSEEILKLKEGSLKNTKSQKHFFKLLIGDTMMHNPYGKIFPIENIENESLRFMDKDISPTGALYGKSKSDIISNISQEIENEYSYKIPLVNQRRYAWIFPQNIKNTYIPEKAHYHLNFTLPKGAYATNLIEFLKGK